jgi:hypothetical protein
MVRNGYDVVLTKGLSMSSWDYKYYLHFTGIGGVKGHIGSDSILYLIGWAEDRLASNQYQSATLSQVKHKPEEDLMIDWRENATREELMNYLKLSGGYVPQAEHYHLEKLRALVFEWDDFSEGDKHNTI